MSALSPDVQARLAAGVGLQLRLARIRADLSPAALSRASGVSSSTVSGIERGVTRPHPDALQAIARAIHPDDEQAAAALGDALVAAAGPDRAGAELRAFAAAVLAHVGIHVDDDEAGRIVAAVGASVSVYTRPSRED